MQHLRGLYSIYIYVAENISPLRRYYLQHAKLQSLNIILIQGYKYTCYTLSILHVKPLVAIFNLRLKQKYIMTLDTHV